MTSSVKLSKMTSISKDRNFPIVKKKSFFLTKGLTQKQKWLYWTKRYLCPTSAVTQGHSKAQTGQLWAGRLDPKHKNRNLNTDFCCPRLQQRQNKVWCEFSVWSNAFLLFWLVKFNNTSWARKPQERKLVFLLHGHYEDSKLKFLYGTIFTPLKNSGLPHGF